MYGPDPRRIDPSRRTSLLMLSIGKLGSGQEHYYTEKVAEGAEDYYSGEGEAEGQLDRQGGGRTRPRRQKVEPDQLTAMLTGRNPVTGEPLGLKSAPGREPVPGFDLTFSAPKSVSLTWALGGHPVSGQVMEAHRAAVEAALSYMERSACWARRGKGGRTFVPGNGFLAAAYVHRSSRAGDPQLHTHVLVANATLGPDGRWSRLYHPAIYEHARTASYLYAAHLRHELTLRLGVEWEPVVNGLADIRGFSAEELRAFSTRRAEILAAVGEGASAKAMRVAALETRKAKDRDLTDESMREGWRVEGPRSSASTASGSPTVSAMSDRAPRVLTIRAGRALGHRARLPLRPPRRDPCRRRQPPARRPGPRGRAARRRLPRLGVGDPDRRDAARPALHHRADLAA